MPDPRVVTVPQRRERAQQAEADLLALQTPLFGIRTSNDEVACTALKALSDLQLAMPDMVNATGHDNTMVAELSTPAHQRRIRGCRADRVLIVSVVLACQGGPVLEVAALRPKVIVRASA